MISTTVLHLFNIFSKYERTLNLNLIFKEIDKCEADYLICIGTSLEVYPFAGLADTVPKQVPRLLINRDRVGTFGNRPRDSILSGDLVESLKKLTEALGWTKELEELCAAKS